MPYQTDAAEQSCDQACTNSTVAVAINRQLRILNLQGEQVLTNVAEQPAATTVTAPVTVPTASTTEPAVGSTSTSTPISTALAD